MSVANVCLSQCCMMLPSSLRSSLFNRNRRSTSFLSPVTRIAAMASS